MSQHKIRGVGDFVYDSDEAEISDEDEDALQQLPLHKDGALCGHLKSSLKWDNYRGGIIGGGGLLGGGLLPWYPLPILLHLSYSSGALSKHTHPVADPRISSKGYIVSMC